MISYVYSPDEAKSLVPIDIVASSLGIPFEYEHNRTFCPFHDDQNNPNLEFMGEGDDGFTWAYCRACGANPDSIDLVRQVKGYSFYSALVYLSSLADSNPGGFKSKTVVKTTKYLPTVVWEYRLIGCQRRAEEHQNIGLLSYSYGLTGDDTPVEERQEWDATLLKWGWGLDESANVIIPHRNSMGFIEAVKMKTRQKTWRCYGSLKSLYGSWIQSESDYAILCEGESDAVYAYKESNKSDLQLCVLSLPSGAGGMKSEWIQQLEMFDIVYLALDGDEAGRIATEKWKDALGDRATDLCIPEGFDLRTCTTPLKDLIV